MTKDAITIKTTINAPLEKVWNYWTGPEHITKWNSASDDWHTPHATNDLKAGGKFTARMEAKDGSMGFDFEGVYQEVEEHALLKYEMADKREVEVKFDSDGTTTLVTETFDPEGTNPLEFQKAGWQSILDNFKKYTEAN